MKVVIFLLCVLISGCEQQPQKPDLEVPLNSTETQQSQPGMLEHMAGAAVAGAAAGSAGAVAHRATDHFINKRQERKAHKRARPRTYNHRR
tara:strand:+ start:46 stop:318 length:273 start_codon:yes stop_codon:yes gene_type:complete